MATAELPPAEPTRRKNSYTISTNGQPGAAASIELSLSLAPPSNLMATLDTSTLTAPVPKSSERLSTVALSGGSSPDSTSVLSTQPPTSAQEAPTAMDASPAPDADQSVPPEELAPCERQMPRSVLEDGVPTVFRVLGYTPTPGAPVGFGGLARCRSMDDINVGGSGSGAAEADAKLCSRGLQDFQNTQDYLDAMQEDLCEWFNRLYAGLAMRSETFFEQIEDGVVLCKHAGVMQAAAEVYFAREREATAQPDPQNPNDTSSPTARAQKGRRPPGVMRVGRNLIALPRAAPPYREEAPPGTFLARDNLASFLAWCRALGVPQYLAFETDDLVLRKNLKNVIVCLLEVARIGFAFGLDVPDIIKLEQEIDSGASLRTIEIYSRLPSFRHMSGHFFENTLRKVFTLQCIFNGDIFTHCQDTHYLCACAE